MTAHGSYLVACTVGQTSVLAAAPTVAKFRSCEWDVEDNGARFIVRNANGQAFSYVHYDNSEPRRRAAAWLLARDEARRIAANIARLPELRRAEQPDANPLTQRRP
jgi:hypothetical protein